MAAFLEGKVQELCSPLTWCHLDEPKAGRRKRWHSRRACTEPLSRMSSDRRATFRWTTSSGWRKLSAFRYTNSSLRTARDVDCSLSTRSNFETLRLPATSDGAGRQPQSSFKACRAVATRLRSMDFETYFELLIVREGGWLRPAKQAIRDCWPRAASELECAAIDLYNEVFGAARDDALADIDAWFYRVNSELNHQRPIDLMRTPEGVDRIRAMFLRLAAGALG